MFAVDVTPKGSIKEECEKLIKEVTEDKKLEFLEGSRNMILSFPAQDGKRMYDLGARMVDANAVFLNYSRNIRPSARSYRLERTQSVLRQLRTTNSLNQRWRQTYLSTYRSCPSQVNGCSGLHDSRCPK